MKRRIYFSSCRFPNSFFFDLLFVISSLINSTLTLLTLINKYEKQTSDTVLHLRDINKKLGFISTFNRSQIMKKLTGILSLVLLISFQASAQYHRNDPRNDRHPHSTYEEYARGDKSKPYTWGYDNQYNRIDRNRANARMISSFQQAARDRIAFGISRGLITGREANRLIDFADRIEMKENRYMRNGRLSPGEVQELKRDLLILDQFITEAKTNAQRQAVQRRPADPSRYRTEPRYPSGPRY